MSTYPKRPRTDDNTAFKRPHSSVEDLKACTQSLSNILDILDTTIKSLDYEAAEFSRQTQLALFDRPFELVTEQDISIAQAQYGHIIDAELDMLIQDAEKTIEELSLEEARLVAKKAEKQKDVDEAAQLIRLTEAENTAKKAQSSIEAKQAHLFTPQQRQEMRKLDNELARLEQLMKYEDGILAEKTKILTSLKKKNLETEKRLELLEKGPPPANIGELELTLQKQVNMYKDKIQQKKHQLEEQRRQQEQQQAQAEAQAEADAQAQAQAQAQTQEEREAADQNPDQQETSRSVSPSETMARYRDLFDVIEQLQRAVNRPDFGAVSDEAVKECEAELEQFHKDLQQDMVKRKAEQGSDIEKLKRLFQVIIPDQAFARTAGRILELLYASDDTQLPLGVLQEVNITGRVCGYML
ncbi:hypothetical protein MBANPS3_003553 [Mucor bainieri]